MRACHLACAAALLLNGCHPAEQPQTAPPALPPPDTEASRPETDAAQLPAPSGDPQDDAPSVDVPEADSAPVPNAGAVFAARLDGQPWPVDSVRAYSGPDSLRTYEELTLRFGTGGAAPALVLRLPLTPLNVAHVPISLPLGTSGPAARLRFDTVDGPLLTGRASITALDRAGRVVSGRVEAALPAAPGETAPRRLVGRFEGVQY